MSFFEIKRLNFLPIRYYCEIHNRPCPICLERMNIFDHIISNGFHTGFKGCCICTFWGHKKCVDYLDKCPICRTHF